MPTIPIFLSDDLHKKFRIKLFQEDRTSKEFFLTAVQVYVKEEKAGPKKEDEEPEDPDPPVKVHNVTDPIEPEGEDKKPKEKTKNGKKPKTRRNQPRGKGKNGGEKTPPVPGEKGGAGPNEPGTGDPGPRRKRGLWPWNR